MSQPPALLVDSVLCRPVPLWPPSIEAAGDDFRGLEIELGDEFEAVPDTKLVLNLLKGDNLPFFSVELFSTFNESEDVLDSIFLPQTFFVGEVGDMGGVMITDFVLFWGLSMIFSTS